MSTPYGTHQACLNHLTPVGHPERPDRLRAIDRVLENERFQTLARVTAPEASIDDIALVTRATSSRRSSRPCPKHAESKRHLAAVRR